MQLSGQRQPGRIRIIGGIWRGTKLSVPDIKQLRPTPDRIRETLFNWLRNVISGAVCLDLFAGSGALGFEAASRGASRVVMVEQNRLQADLLQQQANVLHAAAVEVIQADAIQWLENTRSEFDLVFLDPPFGGGLLARVLPLLRQKRLLRQGGLIYAEAETGLAIDPGEFEITKQKRAGQVQYVLLQ